MVRRLPAAVLGLLLVLTGCTSDAPRAGAPITPGPGCRAAPPPSGYAVTGDIKLAVVRRVSLCPISLGDPVLMPAEQQRVSWLSGTGAEPVVAEFGTGVDRIYRIGPTGPAPVPDFAGVGHAPALGPDGRIAFLDQTSPNGVRQFRIRAFDPATKKTTTLARFAGPPSGPVWTSGGRLALVSDTGADDAALVVIDRPGAKPRRLAVVGSDAVNVYALGSGDLGVILSNGDPVGARMVVYDSAGGERARVGDEWRPVGATSDGALVAVHRDTREVARLAGPRYREPQVYGVLPAGEQVWHMVL